MIPLETSAEFSALRGEDISGDGGTIVGSGANRDGKTEAFRWDPVNGATGLGDVDGGEFQSVATECSEDGSIIAGIVTVADISVGDRAARWTADSGWQILGELPKAYVTGMSSDGSVIAGRGREDGAGSVYQGFRWTEEAGMVSLGSFRPWAVSGNGAVIVGEFYPSPGHAAIWTTTGGLRDLKEWLIETYGMGDALAGWTLEEGKGISSDGRKIVGDAKNPSGFDEAWLVVLPPLDPPAISVPPTSAVASAGAGATLTVEATGDELTYRWQLDGVDIPGANTSTYAIPSAQAFHGGAYAVVVSNAAGSATSDIATLTVEDPVPSDARLLNLSTRGLAEAGANQLFPGFVISGTGTKKLLIRAVGPSLAALGFADPVIPDPRMELKQFNVTTQQYDDLLANDDWGTNTNAANIVSTSLQVSAFALTDDRDAALLVDLGPGQYAVVGGDKDGTPGIGIVELYDADAGSPTARLINISNRGFCGVGSQVMIPGFVVSSEGPKTFLVRVVGPTLTGLGVPGVMADPKLELYKHNFTTNTDDLLLTQDNWGESAGAATTASVAAQVFAFPLEEGSADAAFVVTLQPGVHTVIGSAADGASTGVVLVEVYVVP